MSYWNKETRNEEGVYYRKGDWSVDRFPERTENFTAISPPKEAFDGMPVDWDEESGEWVGDVDSWNSKKELAELDSIGELNRTVEEIVDALASSTTIEEVYSKISDYGKAKIANRKAIRDKIK